jgi:hypothetical protein
MPPLVDLRGVKFGRLRAVYKIDSKWYCECDCGRNKIIEGSSLRGGRSNSCGCGHKKVISKPPGKTGFRLLFMRYTNNAKSRGFDFPFTEEEFKNIITQECFYCGEKPRPFNAYCRKGEKVARIKGRYDQWYVDRSWINVNGIDRMDSNLPYSIENCVPCCVECNISKMRKSTFEFINHAIKIANYQKFKNEQL